MTLSQQFPDVTQRRIETNGITLNIAEQGDGPLVLLLHGFPESWFSWRHQFSALSETGFHAVAPDMEDTEAATNRMTSKPTTKWKWLTTSLASYRRSDMTTQ